MEEANEERKRKETFPFIFSDQSKKNDFIINAMLSIINLFIN